MIKSVSDHTVRNVSLRSGKTFVLDANGQTDTPDQLLPDLYKKLESDGLFKGDVKIRIYKAAPDKDSQDDLFYIIVEGTTENGPRRQTFHYDTFVKTLEQEIPGSRMSAVMQYDIEKYPLEKQTDVALPSQEKQRDGIGRRLKKFLSLEKSQDKNPDTRGIEQVGEPVSYTMSRK
ncbi:MAG: hypothetical protein V4691_02645 [Pseudomonadota bacterium]